MNLSVQPKENMLKTLKKGDYMENAGRQDFVKNTSMTLIFYSNIDKKVDNPMIAKFYKNTPKADRNQWTDIEIGVSCQNTELNIILFIT